MDIKKIAIVGPESTGKSTISADLARHYQTAWVPEFSRDYCSKLTEPCSLQDELNMFYGQLELEKEILPAANKILFCDTTIMTVKIWCDFTFGFSPQEVLDKLLLHSYDFYLLMDIDLPWQEDPLRDFPTMREHFMDIWHRELQALDAHYVVVSGNNHQRLTNSVLAVDYYLRSAL